jgi:hypothetical protein
VSRKERFKSEDEAEGLECFLLAVLCRPWPRCVLVELDANRVVRSNENGWSSLCCHTSMTLTI